VRLTEDRLRQEVDEIAAAMAQRPWPKIVFGTIAGIASVATTAVERSGDALGGIGVSIGETPLKFPAKRPPPTVRDIDRHPKLLVGADGLVERDLLGSDAGAGAPL
jgi:hypothetical protein